MNLFTLDFETYYDTEYSLTKMSTEDYVNDPRFEIILVGAKRNLEAPVWYTGTKADIAAWFDDLGLWDGCMVAHNNIFDALILAVHFGKLPAKVLCTRMMAQVFLRPYMRSVSLENCLLHLDLGVKKGTAVHQMKGRTRKSLSRAELRQYAEYCMDDCEGDFRVFRHLAPMFPRDELDIIDLTLRMYLEPRFKLDATVLAETLGEVRAKKEAQLAALPATVTKDRLTSNPKFAALLESLGVDVPTKISPTTGEITYAFAKQDTGWKELEDEYADDSLVSTILAARLGAKSTIEESRAERLLDISSKYSYLRIPLMYYAAHTGRYGGMEKLNAQNFPRIDKSRMRFGIKAPKHHVVLAADLAQIEARITAWLAGQTDLVEAFRNKDDIYSNFATRVFKQETVKDRSPEDKKRRFVGKTCILGLGFGMGAPKLKATLRKDGLIFDDVECARMVDTYRTLYSGIPRLWHNFDMRLSLMSQEGARARIGPVTLGYRSIILPNGMPLHYHKLRMMDGNNKKGYRGWAYSFGGEMRTLWGGKVTENVVQALARIIVMENMLAIWRELGLRPALQQHDELDYVVMESEAEGISAQIGRIMSKPPSWAPDLPVAVEIAYGKTLGDCK